MYNSLPENKPRLKTCPETFFFTPQESHTSIYCLNRMKDGVRQNNKNKKQCLNATWELVLIIFCYLITCSKHVCVSCSVVCDSLQPHGLQSVELLCPWNSPGKKTGVGWYFLLQGIFPTQESKPGLPHCRLILYSLSQQRSPDRNMAA